MITSKSRRVAVIWPFGAPDQAGLGQFYLRAFRNLGHVAFGAAIHEVDPWTLHGHLLQRPRVQRWHLQRRVRTLRSELEKREVELVLVIKAEELSAELVAALRPRSGVPLVLYHPDSPIWVLRPHRSEVIEALREYDLVVTFAKVFVPVFRQIGVRAVARIPFAYDPSVHRPVELPSVERERYTSRLSYAGNTGPLQRHWLERLSQFEPRPFGAGWETSTRAELTLRRLTGYQRYVQSLPGFGADLAKVCAGADVMINLVRAETDCAHSMKTFELPACGACVVANRTDEQLEFFPEGCAYFDTFEEAKLQVGSLLEDRSARQRLVNIALEEARPHTYDARAEALLDIFAA